MSNILIITGVTFTQNIFQMTFKQTFIHSYYHFFKNILPSHKKLSTFWQVFRCNSSYYYDLRSVYMPQGYKVVCTKTDVIRSFNFKQQTEKTSAKSKIYVEIYEKQAKSAMTSLRKIVTWWNVFDGRPRSRMSLRSRKHRFGSGGRYCVALCN